MDATGRNFPPRDELERRLPRYRLVRKLSETGMSVVYKAIDTQVGDRPVALKVLAPEVHDNAEYRRRFVREVHNAGRLQHPNIVPIHDGPEAGGLYFLTMPFIEGYSLGEMLKRRGRLDPPEAARIVGQVAAALEYAHSRGLVHRDVKPGNILIEARSEHAYLCDFGIAKEMTAEPLTQIGAYIGTPGYIAPEAIRHEDVDQRSDIYALGVVLYQCLTGRQPHQESGQSAKLAAQIRDEAPPPSAVRPGLPPRLDAVVAKAMAKRPADRYAGCREFAADLATAVQAAGDPAVPRGWTRHLRRPAVLVPLAAAVVALAVAAAFLVPTVLADDDRLDPKLLSAVPAQLRSDCRQADPASRSDGMTTELSCRSEAGQEVRFDFFRDRAAMDRAYDRAVRDSRVARATGDCTAATGAEHRYPGVGTPKGRVLCHSQSGSASLVWTSDDAKTVAHLDGRDSDDLRMARAWSSWMRLPAFPAEPEQALLDLLDVSRTDCRRAPPGSLDQLRDVTAGIECTSAEPGATAISYFRFAGREGLRRSYNDDVRRANAPGNVYCGDGEAPEFLGSKRYDLRSVELGGLLCHPESHGRFVIEWSVEPLSVLGRAVGNDSEKLAEWWRSSYGPPTSTIVRALNADASPQFPTAEERRLLDHIPAASRANCIRPSKSQIRSNVGDADVTAVVCGPTSGAKIVFYYQFRDRKAMDRSFAANGPPNGPDCTSNPPKFTGSAPYTKDGRPAGRLLCGTNDADLPFLSWTNDKLRIQGFAFQAEEIEPLLNWWRTEAGPD